MFMSFIQQQIKKPAGLLLNLYDFKPSQIYFQRYKFLNVKTKISCFIKAHLPAFFRRAVPVFRLHPCAKINRNVFECTQYQCCTKSPKQYLNTFNVLSCPAS